MAEPASAAGIIMSPGMLIESGRLTSAPTAAPSHPRVAFRFADQPGDEHDVVVIDTASGRALFIVEPELQSIVAHPQKHAADRLASHQPDEAARTRLERQVGKFVDDGTRAAVQRDCIRGGGAGRGEERDEERVNAAAKANG